MTRLVDRYAVVLVGLAAMLWGTDTAFRVPVIGNYPSLLQSTRVVFAETLILTVLAAPVLWRRRGELARLSRGQWLAVAFVGFGAQALATVLFTLSFSYGHFIETLLLQKIQPLIAILLASLWLRERLSPQAWVWIPLALVGAYLIAVPEPLQPRLAWQDFHLQAGLLAVGAAALWGAATVFGRYTLRDVSFPTMTSLRFAAGLPALAVTLAVMAGAQGFAGYRAQDAVYYVGLALVPGLIAMMLYYRGLASTPASIAALAELAFPITGVLLNMRLFHQNPTALQLAGIAVLWTSLAALDWANARHPQPVGPRVATTEPAGA